MFDWVIFVEEVVVFILCDVIMVIGMVNNIDQLIVNGLVFECVDL